jgi:Bacterial transcriptional activator domain
MMQQVLEVRLEADLSLGGHAAVIPELRRLVILHPFREHLRGLLMLALYRDGQLGEALASYQDARRILRQELGADPGVGLCDLHQRILAADPALDAVRPVPVRHSAQAAPVVPRYLPGTTAHFAGRAGELAMLDRLLDEASRKGPGTVVISAVGGTAGVGKTKPRANTSNRYRRAA